MKFVAGLFGGLIMSIVGTFTTILLFAFSPNIALIVNITTFLVLWGLGFVIAFKAKRPALAWRRLLIISGIFTLTIPIAGLIFGGSLVKTVSELSDLGEEPAGLILGATIGSGAYTVFLGFVSFFLSAIFLITGILIGRDRGEE